MISLTAARKRRNLILKVTQTFFLLAWMCMTVNSGRPGAPRWWNIIQLLPTQSMNRSASIKGAGSAKSTLSCSKIPGLVPKQLRFCRKYNELMRSIAEGTRNGIHECQYQFQGRRWNCSTAKLNNARAFRRKSIFGDVLETGSREAAFVHAIATAAVAHTVTRACSAGILTLCGCDPAVPELAPDVVIPLHNKSKCHTWEWGDCNDDVQYGVKVSRDFIDAHNRETTARGYMNIHNNEAGRQILIENVRPKCKCHGFSGSCELETCWMALPSLREVGDKLEDKYAGATEMTTEKHKETRGRVEVLTPKYTEYQEPSQNDLIYYESSLDYCDRNRKKSILGTRGRRCNMTSDGIDGCELLCCNRGHETHTVTVSERCNCVFHWCCEVTCDKCERQYQVSTCK